MDCLASWRRWVRPVLTFIYVGSLLLVALPLCVWELNRRRATIHVQAWFVAALFVFMTIPISLWGILQHLVHYTQPKLQRHIVRILWMVPIYALDAWLALRFPPAAIYLDTARECYEAFVIYNFTMFLLQYLNQERRLEDTLAAKPQVQHIFPVNYLLREWRMGRELVENCKHGALQYAVVRPIATAIALITELAGVYNEGEFTLTGGAWLYLVLINNVSQIFAMYCLVLFYRACREELRPMKPLAKFACVKFVVFVSFWQSVVVAGLVALGVIHDNPAWRMFDAKSVATAIQDFAICLEMFVAALAHIFAFPHSPYVVPNSSYTSCLTSFLSMFDVTDLRQDMREHARVVRRRVHNLATGTSHLISGSSSSSHLVSGDEKTSLLDESFRRARYETADEDAAVVFTPMSPISSTMMMNNDDVRGDSDAIRDDSDAVRGDSDDARGGNDAVRDVKYS